MMTAAVVVPEEAAVKRVVGASAALFVREGRGDAAVELVEGKEQDRQEVEARAVPAGPGEGGDLAMGVPVVGAAAAGGAGGLYSMDSGGSRCKRLVSLQSLGLSEPAPAVKAAWQQKRKTLRLRVRGMLVMAMWLGTAALGLVCVAVPLCVVVRLFSISLGRRLTHFLIGLWLSLWALLVEHLNGTKVIFSGEELPLKERALLLCNHPTESDWMFLWCLALRKGRLGDVKYMIKSSVRNAPIFGWGFHLAEYLFVERKWEVDRINIRNHLASFVRYATPLWMVVFPEGTDFTPAKKERSQAYAREHNLPVLEHVLLPKCKGYHACLEALHGTIDAVYDITIGYQDRNPYFCDIVYGAGPHQVHMHVRRWEVGEVPREEAATLEWMKEVYVEKDRLLHHFHKTGSFEGPPVQEKAISKAFERVVLTFFAAIMSLICYLLVTSCAFRIYTVVSFVFCMLASMYGWLPR
eukprot:jgi/Chlat1/3705/Chrsp251S03865